MGYKIYKIDNLIYMNKIIEFNKLKNIKSIWNRDAVIPL